MRGVMMERVVRWTLNGVRQPPFLCTPEHLDDLALGYLLMAALIYGYTFLPAPAAEAESSAAEAEEAAAEMF